MIVIALGLAACPSTVRGPLQPWPEADQLFRGAERWHGADGAYSVDLGAGRVLWLFGDSFVGPVDEPGTRSGSRMVSNSLAIQQGYDPTVASIVFYYDDSGDEPGAFFADEGDLRLWPGPAAHLARADGEPSALLLTFVLVRSVEGGLGFETAGSRSRLVENPEDEPPAWRHQELELPEQGLGVQLGAGALFVDDAWMYSYAPVEPGSHDLYLARWRVDDVAAGDLSAVEWWGDGWSPDWHGAVAIVEGAQTELSVHRDDEGLLWLVSVDGFGSTNIIGRTASAPQGPWSEPRLLHRPDESDRRDVLVYSAKAHPELEGGEMVVTYCTNTLDFWDLASDMTLYFPRFARLGE